MHDGGIAAAGVESSAMTVKIIMASLDDIQGCMDNEDSICIWEEGCNEGILAHYL